MPYTTNRGWTVLGPDGEYDEDGHLCWPTPETAEKVTASWRARTPGLLVVRRHTPCHTYTCECGKDLVDIYAHPHFPSLEALRRTAVARGWGERTRGDLTELVCPDCKATNDLEQIRAEHDGAVALLREARRILRTWTGPGSTGRGSSALHCVAELNRLLNPNAKEIDP